MRVRSRRRAGRKKVRTSRTPLACFLALAAMAGCSKTIEWEEEVGLTDGRTIEVHRSVTLGPQQYFPERVRFVIRQALSFDSPKNPSQTIRYENDGSLSPMALDLLPDGRPMLVTLPVIGRDHVKWKCPSPPYVAFVYDGAWKRVRVADVPARVVDANLIVSGIWNRGMDAGRRFSKTEVSNANASLSKVTRTIDRNAKGVDDCAAVDPRPVTNPR